MCYLVYVHPLQRILVTAPLGGFISIIPFLQM